MVFFRAQFFSEALIVNSVILGLLLTHWRLIVFSLHSVILSVTLSLCFIFIDGRLCPSAGISFSLV